MNNQQKIKKYELDLYSKGITRQYLKRVMLILDNDINEDKKVIEELKNGRQ